MKNFATNTKVSWSWGNGEAEGFIRKKYSQRITRTISGTEVTRNANDDNPAYLIEQSDGQEVIKSASEIAPASD